jgi:hypothetical protein
MPIYQAEYRPGNVYTGYEALAQGIAGLGGGLVGAYKQHEQDLQTDASNQYLATQAIQAGQVPPEALGFPAGATPSPAEMLAKYQGMPRQKQNGIVAGITANYIGTLQAQQAQRNEILQRGNLYGAQAAAYLNQPGAVGRLAGRVWSPELGGYVTPAQRDAAVRRTTAATIQANYGLTPQQILNSKRPDGTYQHEAGTVTIDPSSGAKIFKNDPKGDFIRIGGESGVVMPSTEHEVYKRRLQLEGYDTSGNPTGGGTTTSTPTTPGAAAPGTVRVRSPQGVVGTIPANRLQQAIAAGYTQL